MSLCQLRFYSGKDLGTCCARDRTYWNGRAEETFGGGGAMGWLSRVRPADTNHLNRRVSLGGLKGPEKKVTCELVSE